MRCNNQREKQNYEPISLITTRGSARRLSHLCQSLKRQAIPETQPNLQTQTLGQVLEKGQTKGFTSSPLWNADDRRSGPMMDGLSRTFSELKELYLGWNTLWLFFLAPSTESWDSLNAREMQAGKRRKSRRKAGVKLQTQWAEKRRQRSESTGSCSLDYIQIRSPAAQSGLFLASVYLQDSSHSLSGPCCCPVDPREKVGLQGWWHRDGPCAMKPTLPEGPRHRNASLSLKVSRYSSRQNETPKRILTTFASVRHKTQG